MFSPEKKTLLVVGFKHEKKQTTNKQKKQKNSSQGGIFSSKIFSWYVQKMKKWKCSWKLLIMKNLSYVFFKHEKNSSKSFFFFFINKPITKGFLIIVYFGFRHVKNKQKKLHDFFSWQFFFLQIISFISLFQTNFGEKKKKKVLISKIKGFTFFHPNIYMYHFTNEKYENKSHNFFFSPPRNIAAPGSTVPASPCFLLSYLFTHLHFCIHFVLTVWWMTPEIWKIKMSLCCLVAFVYKTFKIHGYVRASCIIAVRRFTIREREVRERRSQRFFTGGFTPALYLQD